MKAVILAGGLGTRISEESVHKPKPMVEVAQKPILWHIMKNLYEQGINEFIICAGYKQEIIKEFFASYCLHNSDVSFDFTNGKRDINIEKNDVENWKVTVVNTGSQTLTGGRLKKVQKYIGDEPFLLTYGDGLADLKIPKLLEFHKEQVEQGHIATLTAANVGQQFGVIDIDVNEIKTSVRNFREKSDSDGGWVNAGFIIFQPEVWQFVDENRMLEDGTLSSLAEKGVLSAYKHTGFWKAMDSVRDRDILNSIWEKGAPWKNWE